MQPDGGREYLLQIRHDLLEWRREIFAIEAQLPSSVPGGIRPADQLMGLRKVVLESRRHLRKTIVGREAREKIDDVLSMHDVLLSEIERVLKLTPSTRPGGEDES